MDPRHGLGDLQALTFASTIRSTYPDGIARQHNVCRPALSRYTPLSTFPIYIPDAAEAMNTPTLLTRGPFGLQDLDRNSRSRAPFRPRAANRGTSNYQLRQFAEATLGNGSLRKVVQLPEGEDLNEWLAVNGCDPKA